MIPAALYLPPDEALLHPLSEGVEAAPRELNNPFCYEPHPLCREAAAVVNARVEADETLLHSAREGEMFGVLVVKRANDAADSRLFFLAAYAGRLAGRNDWPWFVPPLFDGGPADGYFKTEEAAISALNADIARLQEQQRECPNADAARRLQQLQQQRRERSNRLLLDIFKQYNPADCHGHVRNVVDIWRDYHRSPSLLKRFPLPPGGTGECCAPKLLHYAFTHSLQPLVMAEWWWGRSPRGEIRHHGQFYPACNGKCKPLLTWMLHPEKPFDGPHREASNPWARHEPYVPTLFDDPSLAVVVKPHGLLSVPGRSHDRSLLDIIRARYPQAEGPIVVHRLDMDTAGLMVVAKTLDAYRHLQRQFAERTVAKTYIAMVDEQPTDPHHSQQSPLRPGAEGDIHLPLAPDYLDRPRQRVDHSEGRAASTHYEVMAHEGTFFRLRLTPHTGRTHQLRVHCASPEGLNHPIAGDDLYGRPADRLYLFANTIAFVHPLTGRPMTFEQAPDF